MTKDNLTKKIIYCTICGPSNVGKSTFLNKIIKCDIAPVSQKVQTTRYSIKGILNSENTQIIFTDTPGVFNVKNGVLEKKISKNAWGSIKFTDFLLIMTDADTKIDANTKKIIQTAQQNNVDFCIAINKSDEKKLSKRLAMIEFLTKEYGENLKIFCISAHKDINTNELLNFIKSKAYTGNWIFSEDEVTDVALDKIISEKVRAFFFTFLEKELPYQIETTIENFKETEDEIEINILLFYLKESHKAILIGKKAENIIKCIKHVAADLKQFSDKKLKIKIKAKLNEKWKENWETLDKFYKIN